MPPVLRRATLDDLPALQRLLHDAYAANEALGVEFHAPAVSEERVRRYLERAEVWVAEEDGRIRGTVGLETAVRVERLAVHPEARGRGLAARLLAHAEGRAVERGFARAELEVDGDHPWLQDFYAGNGWKAVGEFRYDEWPGWHTVAFEKRLR